MAEQIITLGIGGTPASLTPFILSGLDIGVALAIVSADNAAFIKFRDKRAPARFRDKRVEIKYRDKRVRVRGRG